MVVNGDTEISTDWRVPYMRTLLLIAIIVIVASAVAAILWYDVGSKTFGALGFIMAVWGVVISIGGFTYTLVQITRTRNATEAVQGAVSNLKFKIKLIDASSDTSRAIKLLENTLIHLKHSSWANAAASLWEAQSVLYRLHANINLKGDHFEIAKKATKDFLDYVQLLDDLSTKNLSGYDTRDIVHDIRVLINILDNAVIESQKELYDV